MQKTPSEPVSSVQFIDPLHNSHHDLQEASQNSITAIAPSILENKIYFEE